MLITVVACTRTSFFKRFQYRSSVTVLYCVYTVNIFNKCICTCTAYSAFLVFWMYMFMYIYMYI